MEWCPITNETANSVALVPLKRFASMSIGDPGSCFFHIALISERARLTLATDGTSESVASPSKDILFFFVCTYYINTHAEKKNTFTNSHKTI